MTPRPLPFETLVFVCTNARAPGERVSCAAAGAALRDALKTAVKERGWASRVRVSASGCIDRCEEGPNVCVFRADGRSDWRAGVSPADLPALLDELTPLPPKK